MNRQPDKKVKRVISIQPKGELKPNVLPRGSKTIVMKCVETKYPQLLEDNIIFKEYLDKIHLEYPELFPIAMKNGYVLCGFTEPSSKLEDLRMRRIKIPETGEIYTIRPSFVMPYMVDYAKDYEPALYLRKFGVPYSALTIVFGHDDMHWHRLEKSFGRNSIVGTTVKDPEKLPQDLVADEKVTKFNGEKACIAETAAEGCILGAAVCKGNGTTELTQGYGIFGQEAKNVAPKYSPETVNTDGGKTTQAAWKAIFCNIFIIQCFLHAFINIRDRCKKNFTELKQKVWHVYRAKTKTAFALRARRLKEYALSNLPEGVVLDKVISLCNKSSLFQGAYDHPNAHRTSNMIDRLMRQQDRYLFMMQYFHGDFISAELNVRAWAILHNFRPYCTRIADKESQLDCPAIRLNGFRYSDNWLENLLISASMAGYKQ